MGTSRKAEPSRQAILEAAYGLFLAQGYTATSMRQIARRAGLALGGIYNHFPGKEAIFVEVLLTHHPYRRILPVLLETPLETPEQFVRRAAKMMFEELTKQPDFLKLMFIEIVEFDGRNMPIIVQKVLPEVECLLERLKGCSEALRPLPPFIIFRAFLGLFFSFYITELLMSHLPIASAQQGALDYFVEIFLHGILLEKPAS